MPKSVQSLWPETIPAKSLPVPAQILRDQGIILSELTKGLLYGDVARPSMPSISKLIFDFYIGVTDKPVRHKLLSIECGLLFDYPVIINNHEASTTVQADTEEAFREQIRLLLQSDVTQELLGRLLAFTKG